MHIGITVPVLTNFRGLVASLNTWRSEKHIVSLAIIDNLDVRNSVPASWNIGCQTLFEEGADAVIVANDDVLCHPATIDNLVECWQRRKPAIVTGYNTHDSGISIREFLLSDLEGPFEENEAPPDFSFFLLARKTWKAVGRFDENFKPAYFEDNDYFTRVVLWGGVVLRTTSAPIYHVGGQTQFKPPADLRRDRVVDDAMFEQNRVFFQAKWGFDPSWEPEVIRRRAYKRPYDDPIMGLDSVPILR